MKLVLEFHYFTEIKQKKVSDRSYANLLCCYVFFFIKLAYKALAGGGSMGGHLFNISKHGLKSPPPPTKDDKTVEQCTILGKRKNSSGGI